jgi:hypothetical protein
MPLIIPSKLSPVAAWLMLFKLSSSLASSFREIKSASFKSLRTSSSSKVVALVKIETGTAFKFLEDVFKSDRSESIEVPRGMVDKIRNYSKKELGKITFKPEEE